MADSGLVGEYFILPQNVAVTDLDLINFDALNPVHTRTDSLVAYPVTFGPGFAGFSDLNNRFAARWSGQIYLDQPGSYTFYLSSDDGSRLTIDGNTIVDNDGLHAELEKSGTVQLAAGYHNLRVAMFENLGAAGVTLSWRTPGSLAKQVVPSAVLFRDARGVVNVTTDKDLFIPVLGLARVEAAGAGNIAAIANQGLIGSFYDLSDASVFSQIPSFVNGNFLRTTAPANEAVVIQLSDLPAHDSLDLEFVLAIIDRWDGNDALHGPDGLRVEVDGSIVFDKTFSNVAGHAQSYSPLPGVTMRTGTNLGFGVDNDAQYDLTGVGALRGIIHPGNSAEIRIYADGACFGHSGESWGIDNLRVQTNLGVASTPVFATDFNASLPANITGPGVQTAVEGFGATVTRLDAGIVNPGRHVDPVSGFTTGNAATAIPGLKQNFAVHWTGPVDSRRARCGRSATCSHKCQQPDSVGRIAVLHGILGRDWQRTVGDRRNDRRDTPRQRPGAGRNELEPREPRAR